MMNSGSFLTYSLIMLLAGLGIPVMAALNGGLGMKLHSPALASTVLLLVASALSAVYLFAFTKVPTSIPGNIPFYWYTGGAFVIFYILTITWIAPKIGIGNAIAFVLLGQLISMAIIDHFQFLNAPHNPVNFTRLTGLILMSVGVFLAVKRG